jgi:hypothetical protein
LNVEEGYENGFKISTRDVLQEDAGNKIAQQQKQQVLKENDALKLDNPESIMISNIVTTLSIAMGINIEYQKDFIINCVKDVLKTTMPKEEDYKKRIKELSNRPGTTTKAPMSYEDLYYTSILYYTLGMFLIAVQTSVPSIKTRKTFPGCVRSFTGFPFDGAGDMSSVRYLTCICYQIRKNVAKPWYVLKNIKEEVIEKKILLAINENLLKLPDVKIKMDEKNEYLLTNPEEEIPKEYDVANWTQFLPPLIPFKIKNLVNISSEFKKSLLDNLKSGFRKQDEQILVIQSKILQFSLAIQERIQDIVKKKDMILSKMNNEYYLENACCEEKNSEKTTTIGYFEKEDSRITEYNTIVTNLSNILADITGYSTAVLLYSPINTKNIYPPISKDFNEIPNLQDAEWEYDNPAGEWKGTAFGDWYDTLSRKCQGYVYLIDRGQTANPRYKKLKFTNATTSNFSFVFANLDGSGANEYTVPKIAGRNYSYINFDDPNKIIDLEPEKENWDILFTRYRHVYYNTTPFTPYSVTGVILNPNKVICAKDSTIGFENITAERLKEFEFTNRKDVVGFDWKRYDIDLNRYDVIRKYTYIIRDTKGFFYKLRFIDFYDEQGVKGAPKFETQRL